MHARLLAGAAAALALAAPAAAHAAAPWGPADTVSRKAGFPQATLSPDGLAVVAWDADNAAYTARASARRRGFGSPFLLRARQRNALSVEDAAVDAAGDTLVALRRHVRSNHRVEAMTIRRRGPRVGPVALSGPGRSAFFLRFAQTDPVRPAARPTLTWGRGSAAIQLSQAVGGRLLVASGDVLSAPFDARCAQTADGTLWATLTTRNGVFLASRPPGGRFSTPAPVASGRGPFRDARIAAGEGDRFIVTWREFDGRTYLARAALHAAGALGAPVTVSSPGERASEAQGVVTTSGFGVVAYFGSPQGGDLTGPRAGRLRVARLGAAPRTATAPGERAEDLAFAADARGQATLAWIRDEPGGPGGTVRARSVTATTGLGTPVRLGDRRENAGALDLAVGPRGDAVLAWTSAGRVRAARRPASR